MATQKFHLTKAELEIMQILWMNGPSTVRAIHNTIRERRDVGYTTTLKNMQQMTDKSFLKRDTTGTAHIYSSNIDERQVQKNLLDDFVERTYRGKASNMVLQALGNHELSDDDIQDIEAFLKKMKAKKK